MLVYARHEGRKEREAHERPGSYTRQLLADLGLGHVYQVFDLMTVAEEEIAATADRYPAAPLEGAFMALCPSPWLLDKAELVYRSHCREVLDRLVRGRDPRPGTAAEVMSALYELSMHAPLNAAAIPLYERLFVQVFERPPPGGDSGPEPWPGAADELLVMMRKKLAQPLRRVQRGGENRG